MNNSSSGWRWGSCTLCMPFLHTRLPWPQFLQVVFVGTRGTALLLGVALALFEPSNGLAIGITASLLLTGPGAGQ